MHTGIIMAYSIPDGAQVLIDGIAMSAKFGIARTPIIIYEVPAGIRHVSFMLQDYEEETKVVDVPKGGYVSVNVILHYKIEYVI